MTRLQDLVWTEDGGGSLVQMLRDGWPGAPDGAFPESLGFIPRLDPVKSLSKNFGKARRNLKGDWTKLPSITFKPTNQFLGVFFAAGWATQLQPEASYKWGRGRLAESGVKQKEKSLQRCFFVLHLMSKLGLDRSAATAASTLIWLAAAGLAVVSCISSSSSFQASQALVPSQLKILSHDMRCDFKND